MAHTVTYTFTATDVAGHTSSQQVAVVVEDTSSAQFPAPGSVGCRIPAANLQVLNPGGAVPSGWEWDGNVLRRFPGAVVLDGYLINGTLYSDQPGMTLRNCIVQAGTDVGVMVREGASFWLDVTIRRHPNLPLTSSQAAIDGDEVHALRCDLRGYSDGIDCGANSDIQWSEIWADGQTVGDHSDGIALWPGSSGVLIRHNWISSTNPDGSQLSSNAAITMGNSDGSPNTVTIPSPTIEYNRLRGGIHVLRLERGIGSATVVGNRIEATSMANAVSVDEPSVAVATWSDNWAVNSTDQPQFVIPRP